MKRVTLVDDWYLALDFRIDGKHVGALLRANVVHADLLCVASEHMLFTFIRIRRGRRSTFTGGQPRALFEPADTGLDFRVWGALQRALIREMNRPVRLVPVGGGEDDPIVVFKAPDVTLG
jgi:hypothetical protein